MSAMSDAVKNGPRMTGARTAHIDAQIKLAEARAKTAHDKATGLRRRAKGDGPLAKSRQLRAAALDATADRHRARANQLRADLAKAKADEAARHVKHVKRTVASTAAEGLTPKAAGQARPLGRAKPGQVAKTTGQAPRRGKDMKISATEHAFDLVHGRATHLRDEAARAAQAAVGTSSGSPEHARAKRAAQARDEAYVALEELRAADSNPTTPTKGTPAMSTVSGEAVNIEQTEASLNQLKTQVSELRGSFEGMAGSLASGGLTKLAGSFSTADDGLESVLTEITAAEKHLSDQEAIAEAAQAAGEMHGDKSFYGA